MKRFVEGEDRRQAYLLPESLDDYVGEDNPVRVVEVFIDELDLGALGFAGVEPAVTGRPAYHPSTMLKLYLYGYLNRLPSSRPFPKGKLDDQVDSMSQAFAHGLKRVTAQGWLDYAETRLAQRRAERERRR
jgi:hypothetical protein